MSRPSSGRREAALQNRKDINGLLSTFQRRPDLWARRSRLAADVAGMAAAPALIGALQHSHRTVREGAAQGLTRLGPVVANQVLPLLESPDPVIVNAALELLAALRDSRILSMLLRSEPADRTSQRLLSLELLGAFSSKGALDSLHTIMSGGTQAEKMAALRGIRRFRNTQLPTVLGHVLSDVDSRVHDAAFDVIEKCSPSPIGSTFLQAVFQTATSERARDRLTRFEADQAAVMPASWRAMTS